MEQPTPRRPRTALAMHASVAEQLFGQEWDRLEAVADLVEREPLVSLHDARARTALASAELLLTGWGVPTLDAAALATAPDLRAVVHAAGTVKGFVTDACWDRGLLVTSVASANARPVAEFTVAAIVLANKGAFLASARMRASHRRATWNAVVPTPGNRGKRIGIIGASRVGRLVVELLQPFENEVVISDPLLSAAEAEAMGATLVDLDDLFATCDVVSLHAPLLPETVGMVDERRLASMRDGATFVNTARGAIVDGPALEAELTSGRINAVIDTTDPEPLPDDSPLHDLPNVFLTPHIAGSTGTELARLASAAIDELERYAAGAPFAHAVTREQLPWIA